MLLLWKMCLSRRNPEERGVVAASSLLTLTATGRNNMNICTNCTHRHQTGLYLSFFLNIELRPFKFHCIFQPRLEEVQDVSLLTPSRGCAFRLHHVQPYTCQNRHSLPFNPYCSIMSSHQRRKSRGSLSMLSIDTLRSLGRSGTHTGMARHTPQHQILICCSGFTHEQPRYGQITVLAIIL